MNPRVCQVLRRGWWPPGGAMGDPGPQRSVFPSSLSLLGTTRRRRPGRQPHLVAHPEPQRQEEPDLLAAAGACPSPQQPTQGTGMSRTEDRLGPKSTASALAPPSRCTLPTGSGSRLSPSKHSLRFSLRRFSLSARGRCGGGVGLAGGCRRGQASTEAGDGGPLTGAEAE